MSICGPACDEPKVVKTNLGANMEELTAGILSNNLRRVSEVYFMEEVVTVIQII